MYVQVLLKWMIFPVDGSNNVKTRVMVCYIPKKFAKNGKHIIINDKHWIVDTVTKIVIDKPIYPEELIREHRKNTGDSLPK